MNQRLGIVAEFDPFHRGHAYLLDKARSAIPGGAVVVAMSGYFTQRGGPAALSPQCRGEMALKCGADLVLELPLTFALSSAQQFARGGVEVLRAAGVTHLFCGSESGDIAALSAAAEALNHPDYPSQLRENLSRGISFAAARQQAVEALTDPHTAAVLRQPNDLLAVSYLEAMAGTGMTLCPVPRMGNAHNAPGRTGNYASASALRQMLSEGKPEQAAACMPEEAGEILLRAWEKGQVCTGWDSIERAVLYRLRQMRAEDFAALPDCSEGLEHRLYPAARQARTLEEFWRAAQSRRYPLSRIRRLTAWAFLSMTARQRVERPLYYRALGFDRQGQQVLREMVRQRGHTVLTAPSNGKALTAAAAEYLKWEERAADLWQLCLNTPGACGSLWTANPVRIAAETGWG